MSAFDRWLLRRIFNHVAESSGNAQLVKVFEMLYYAHGRLDSAATAKAYLREAFTKALGQE